MKTLFHNGKIYVERNHFEEAVLVEEGLIQEVGNTQDLVEKYPEADRVDLEGHTLIPGLNDSHLHFMQTAESMHQVDIEGVPSIDEMIRRCQVFLAENPERCENGLHAIGWNQDYFTDSDRLPNRHDLDKISTEIPIVLERVCGHIVSSNTKAIEILGIDGDTPQYPGGEFYIGEDGYPNGIYTENACNYVKDLIPDFSMEERREMMVETMHHAVSQGLTSVQSNDVGTTFMDGPAAFALLKDIYASGEAPLRYRHQVCFNDLEDFKHYITEGEYAHREEEYPEDSWLTLGPLKLFKDGSLGARTAYMKNDYADDPENHGVEWTDQANMRAFINIASEHGMQVITHVIGDRAIEDTIVVYEENMKEGRNDLRHTLVHCQITDGDLVRRIADSDVNVMAQPIFLDYDTKIVEDRCGKDLASTSYAFKSLKDLGAHVSYGTDAPVEPYNPFPNIYMAVTRKDREGNPPEGFFPDERVDIYDAIDAYTIESAYSEFMEDKKGRIKKGYYADMVLLDRDIFTIDPMEIKDISPLMTIVGGNIVYEK